MCGKKTVWMDFFVCLFDSRALASFRLLLYWFWIFSRRIKNEQIERMTDIWGLPSSFCFMIPSIYDLQRMIEQKFQWKKTRRFEYTSTTSTIHFWYLNFLYWDHSQVPFYFPLPASLSWCVFVTLPAFTQNTNDKTPTISHTLFSFNGHKFGKFFEIDKNLEYFLCENRVKKILLRARISNANDLKKLNEEKITYKSESPIQICLLFFFLFFLFIQVECEFQIAICLVT